MLTEVCRELNINQNYFWLLHRKHDQYEYLFGDEIFLKAISHTPPVNEKNLDRPEKLAINNESDIYLVALDLTSDLIERKTRHW